MSDFQTKPLQKKIEKPWGYELILTPPDAPFTHKILHFDAGKRFSLQYHDQKIEVLNLISGEAKIILEDEDGNLNEIKMELYKGYFVKAGQKHRCCGITDCDIAEASTPEIGNTVRIEDDYNRPNESF